MQRLCKHTDRQICLAFLYRGKKPICGQKNCLEKERFEEISAKISKFEMDGSKKMNFPKLMRSKKTFSGKNGHLEENLRKPLIKKA